MGGLQLDHNEILGKCCVLATRQMPVAGYVAATQHLWPNATSLHFSKFCHVIRPTLGVQNEGSREGLVQGMVSGSNLV
jgi:hypothetical protein